MRNWRFISSRTCEELLVGSSMEAGGWLRGSSCRARLLFGLKFLEVLFSRCFEGTTTVSHSEKMRNG